MTALRWVLDNIQFRTPAPDSAETSGCLVLLHVQSPPINLNPGGIHFDGPAAEELEVQAFTQAIETHQKRITKAILDHALEICAGNDVNLRTEVLIVDPKEKICEAVENFNADFLVMVVITFSSSCSIKKIQSSKPCLSWSQKLLFQQGRFCLNVPFTFPAYVIPTGKRVTKKEKILLKVNSCIGTEISCQCTSHPIKEVCHEARKLSFVSDAIVKAWSNTDFNFSYAASSSDITGGVLLQSPPLNDFDAREMFCFYFFPGNNQTRKVFRKEVVFVIDYSRSMQGSPIESVRTTILASLSEFDPEDSFNIIAFDSETCVFSSKMEKATHGSILNVTQWLSSDLTSEGSTNILLPIQQAVKLSDASDSIPLIYLITDGAVEDERDICSTVKDYLKSRGSFSPRISTFGIGRYCNHIFLQMLAQIGHGHYDCSYDADSIGSRLERLFTKASSIFLANITTSLPEHLDVFELFPSHIPDLSFESPLIISGRYKGDFSDNVKVSGTLADMTNFKIDLKVQNAKDVALDRKCKTTN